MTNTERLQRIFLATARLSERERETAVQKVGAVLSRYAVDMVGGGDWTWEEFGEYLTDQLPLDVANKLEASHTSVVNAVDRLPLAAANELDAIYTTVADRASEVRRDAVAATSGSAWALVLPVIALALVVDVWALGKRK